MGAPGAGAARHRRADAARRGDRTAMAVRGRASTTRRAHMDAGASQGVDDVRLQAVVVGDRVGAQRHHHRAARQRMADAAGARAPLALRAQRARRRGHAHREHSVRRYRAALFGAVVRPVPPADVLAAGTQAAGAGSGRDAGAQQLQGEPRLRFDAASGGGRRADHVLRAQTAAPGAVHAHRATVVRPGDLHRQLAPLRRPAGGRAGSTRHPGQGALLSRRLHSATAESVCQRPHGGQRRPGQSDHRG
eukprot:ctg_20.g8